MSSTQTQTKIRREDLANNIENLIVLENNGESALEVIKELERMYDIMEVLVEEYAMEGYAKDGIVDEYALHPSATNSLITMQLITKGIIEHLNEEIEKVWEAEH